MEEEDASGRRHHWGGIVEEASMQHHGPIMEEASWRRHQRRGIREEASVSRIYGGGIVGDAARMHHDSYEDAADASIMEGASGRKESGIMHQVGGVKEEASSWRREASCMSILDALGCISDASGKRLCPFAFLSQHVLTLICAAPNNRLSYQDRQNPDSQRQFGERCPRAK